MKEQQRIPESIVNPGTTHDLARQLAGRVRKQQKASRDDVAMAVILEDKAREMLVDEKNQAVKGELTSAIRFAQEVLTKNATHIHDPDDEPELSEAPEASGEIVVPDPYTKGEDGHNWMEEHVFQNLAHYGPSVAKLLAMIGGGIATYTTGLLIGTLAGKVAGVDFIWYPAAVVWAFGLNWELAFLYSWVVKGSDKIAGDQVGLVNRMHLYTILFMASGVIMGILKQVIGDAMNPAFIVWVAAEIIGAFCLLWMYFKIKGSHPLYGAREQRITLTAQREADLEEERMLDHELELDYRKHNRGIKRQDLALTKVEDSRVLASRAYRKEKRISSKHRLLGNVRKKNAKLLGDGTEGNGKGQPVKSGWGWNPFSKN